MKKFLILSIAPSFLVLSSLVSCNKNKVEKISANCPNTFMVNNTINKNDIKVIATYTNNTNQYVTDWTCDLFGNQNTYTFKNDDVGYKDFTIKYNSKSTTLKISVIESTSDISFKKVNVYMSDSGSPKSLGYIYLAFLPTENEIPYINVLSYLNSFKNGVYNFTKSQNEYLITNTIWSSDTYKPCAHFDISANKLTYDDYTCFVCADSSAYNPLELCNGKSRTDFNLVSQTYTAGDELTIDLDDYSIKAYEFSDNLFLPFYTTKSLFTINTTSFFYNGDALYIDAKQESTAFNTQVRNSLFTPTTKYLEYGYNQFALDIDLHFGMRNFSRKLRSNNNSNYKYMGGTGGNAYSVLSPLKSKFITSAEKFDEATHDFYKTYLDDGGHTGLLSRSYYKPVNTSISYGNEIIRSSTISSNIYNARVKLGVSTGGGMWKITNSEKDPATETTITTYTLIFSFNQFATAELKAFKSFVNYINDNSDKVRHVIIDLSFNGGGYVYFSEMLINWLTKGRASNHILSSVNGSKSTYQFNTDNNGDETIDENDYLPSTVKTVDLITSGKSFSAANYTACQVAKYGDDSNTKIYINGENSGGGVCAVEGSMMNCIGMTAQWSSLYRLCEEKNDGSWVGVDDGVTSITKTDGSQVTINGESWNSLNSTEVLNYPNYVSLNSKILSR